MLFIIVLKIILIAFILFLAFSFWPLIKRNNYLVTKLQDLSYLSNFISSNLFLNVPDQIARYAEKTNMGYAGNLMFTIKSDKDVIRRMKLVFGGSSILLILLLLIYSFYYGIAALVVFFLPAFLPLSQSAKLNALTQIQTLAVILHKWHTENPIGCAAFVEKAFTLRPLYEAIEKSLSH